MKKICIVTLMGFLFYSGYAQVTQAAGSSSGPVTQKSNVVPYDSAENFLGYDVDKYKGQELYVCGLPGKLRPFGYDGFVINYRSESTDSTAILANIYKGMGNTFSVYDSLVNKYFKVLEVLKHPHGGSFPDAFRNLKFLKLQETESKSIFYYLYDCETESKFPFMAGGYWAKAKRAVMEQSFVFPNRSLAGVKDLAGPKPIKPVAGDKWKCIDVKPDSTGPKLLMIMQNSAGNKIGLAYTEVIGEHPVGYVMTAKEAEKLGDTWGAAKFDSLLQGIIPKGSNADMCRLAWGEPEKIDRTPASPTEITEIWNYSGGRKITLYNSLVTEVHQ